MSAVTEDPQLPVSFSGSWEYFVFSAHCHFLYIRYKLINGSNQITQATVTDKSDIELRNSIRILNISLPGYLEKSDFISALIRKKDC